MPALANPRHEAFARAIFAGLFDPKGKPSNGAIYSQIGYTSNGVGQPGGSAEVNACRLLKKAKILDRVNELVADAQRKQQKTIDVSRDRFARRLDLASRMAEQQENPMAIGTNEMHLAKIFGIVTDQERGNSSNMATAQSLQDIGRALLVSAGLPAPPDEAIAAAVEAHGQFMSRLDEIREIYQGQVIEAE